MNSHALEVLQFGPALDIVARNASSMLGAAAVRMLEPRTDPAWIATELQRVDEMRALLDADGRWGIPALPDVRDALVRLALEGGVLDALSLRGLGVLLASSRELRAAILPARDSYPLLAILAEGLVQLQREEAEIARVIDEHGEVQDHASPELARLRRESKALRSRVVERLAAFAASLPDAYRVADASVSVREGRYVVPIRREGRGDVGGIVHGESGTGATLFVEPPVAIAMMNRLRELEAEEAREVLRILRALTALLRPHHAGLRASLDALVELDSLYARGRYALRVHASIPTVLPAATPEYAVVEGRHPILLATTEQVVPFDLVMDADERTLVISGPNTGGKTVLLKAMGLLSLLTQSGVLPPVGPGTRLPVFRDVFADVGDEQSIEASLSTFAAHLKNIRGALEGAGADSLVLLDELGSGTDPTEGAALARAALAELGGRGALTVATTHLGQLKLLAGELPGVVNASLQFDAEQLRSTYRVIKGVPGRSYGLAIARRLGLPIAVIERAEAELPHGERDVARLALELEATEKRLAETSAALEARLAETDHLRAELERRRTELRRREVDSERRSRQQARDLLLRSRQEVEAAIREVRDTASNNTALDEAATAARRRVEQAALRQRERAPESQVGSAPVPRGPAVQLEAGMRVRIESLGRTGTVVELRDGKATVEAGGMRLVLPRGDLSVLPAGDQEPAKPRRNGNAGGGYLAGEIVAHPEVDLRGLRVDELPMRMGKAMDDAILCGLGQFRIIHGKGTGALRERVQEMLRDDPRILSFRAGEHGEGGTGVTVVEFG
jgi:DNA mismatch repair protein MutS2